MESIETPRKKRTQRDYTLPFKLAIVESVEKGEMTYKQAQEIYGIQGKSTVLVWVRKHGTLDWSISMKNLKKLNALKKNSKTRSYVLYFIVRLSRFVMKEKGQILEKRSFPSSSQSSKRESKTSSIMQVARI